MIRYGIQVYLDCRWLFIETATREEAATLQRLSAEKCSDLISSRQVLVTDEGHFVTVHATD